MKISDLILKNFRKYEHARFCFHPNFTVIIGDNASGKTQILDAISILLSSYILDFGIRSAKHISASDVRLAIFEEQELVNVEPQYPVTLQFSLSLRDAEFSIKRELLGKNGRTTWNDARELKEAGRSDQEKVQNNTPVNLPLIAYYGTGRLWHMKRHTEKFKPESKIAAYRNCLDPNSDHIEFQKWFEAQETIAIQKRKQIPPVEAVRKAVINAVPECKNFYYDTQFDRIVLELNDEQYCPFDNLSDGFRNMVAMIADIAHRAARLNPHFGSDAALKTTGIVLIDEIDLHLHPKWQRQVVGDLQRTFPNIQFITTTHSPFIIQSTDTGEVIDLNQPPLNVDSSDTYNTAAPGAKAEYANRSIEDISEEVMGVDTPQRSHRYQQMFDTAKEYYSILQDAKNVDTAKKEQLKNRLDELSAPFSENVAYHAFLEMKRIAAGLGDESDEEDQ